MRELKVPGKIFALPIIIIALVFGACPASTATMMASGNSLYVSPNGSDSNPGTIDQPWQTIGKANQSLQPGDTLYIREGTYAEIIEPYRSGTANSPITYQNYQNEEVTITGKNAEDPVVAIGTSVEGPSGADSYIIVEGLNIIHSNILTNGKTFFNITITGSNSTNNVIRNCRIIREGGGGLSYMQQGTRESGIKVTSAKNTLLEGNTISGVGKMGIQLRDVQNITIRDNVISHVAQNAINISRQLSPMIQGILIENNILEWGEIEDGIQFEQVYGDGSNTSLANQGVVIRNNTIRFNAENAIDLKGASNIVIEGNVIYGNYGDGDGPEDGNDRTGNLGGIVHGVNASTRDVIVRNNLFYDNFGVILLEDGFKIYNNTFVGNNRDYTGSSSSWSTSRKPQFVGILAYGSSNNSITNNIFVEHFHGELTIRLRLINALTLDHNLYWNSGEIRFADFRDNSDFDYLGFDAWKDRLSTKSQVTGAEQHSVVADPLFAISEFRPAGNQGEYDYHLREGSPAIDAGNALTKTRSAGNGTVIPIMDARFFFAGYGITAGDSIQVGPNDPVTIIAVDYSGNNITVNKSISWGNRDAVSLPYNGAAPDIGAYEYAGSNPDPEPPPPPSSIFIDVPTTHQFFEEIMAIYNAGYVAGCSIDPPKYCPEDTMNRAESAVFVERGVWGADFTPQQPSSQLFEDLLLSSWASKWAIGLFNDGYTAGCGTNPYIYCPWDEHTRTEGAVFFLRMMHGADYVPPPASGIFNDVPVEFWGAKWAEAAYEAGLVLVCSEEPLNFCPDEPLTRGLAAWMMVQAKGMAE